MLNHVNMNMLVKKWGRAVNATYCFSLIWTILWVQKDMRPNSTYIPRFWQVPICFLPIKSENFWLICSYAHIYHSDYNMKTCWKSWRIDTLCLTSVINNVGILFPLNTSTNQYDASVCGFCQVLISDSSTISCVSRAAGAESVVLRSKELLHCIITQITWYQMNMSNLTYNEIDMNS